MSYHSERKYHTDRMRSFLGAMERGFQSCGDLEDERSLIKSTWKDMAREWASLVQTCSGIEADGVWMYEPGFDAIDEAFLAAFDKRGIAADDRPVSHRPPAGVAVDHARL